jgi:hypothetical protein
VPSRRHPRGRPRDHDRSAAPIVLTPHDALTVIVAVRDLLGDGVVAALVLDPRFHPTELALTDDDDEMEERTRLLLDLSAGDTGGVVLASWLEGVQPTLRDARRFERLRAHGEVCGTPLLDWFLLGERAAVSIAGLVDAPWRWPVPEPDASHSG